MAVGGHFGAGETLPDVLREVGEELGFLPELEALHRLETRRVEHRLEHRIDRELQEVYLLVMESLPVMRPNPIELQGVLQVAAEHIVALFSGVTTVVPALQGEQSSDGVVTSWRPATLTAEDFVPANDGYWERIARASRQMLAGKRDVGLR